MTEVLVLVERSGGTPRKATLELLTLARRLGEPAALVCGPADDAIIEVLGEYGASRVYVVDDPDRQRLPGRAQGGGAGRTSCGVPRPAAVLVTSSREGTEVAARAAVRLDSGIITDAIGRDARRRTARW